MDRQIIYPTAVPLDTDLLNTNRNAMIALAYGMQAVLGNSTTVDGLYCIPTTPASMAVIIGPGSIYAQASLDATSYGSLGSDTTDQILKQGIVIPTTNFTCPAPSTSGQSVVYLVQAAFQEVDGGSTVLPYYNASNPSVPYSGPANSGTPNYTVRQGKCVLALKTGVAATTGTQAVPAPDAGYIGLWAITVANGATTVTGGNITQVSAAWPKLPAVPAHVQAGQGNYAVDSSGAANTIVIALSPAPASLTGMRVWVKVANTSTGSVVMNTNNSGNVATRLADGTSIPAGRLQAGGVYPFAHDGTSWQLQGLPARIAFSAYVGYSSNTTLTAANLGNFVALDTGAQATLPLASACPIGETIWFEALTGGGSVVRGGSNTINVGDGGGTVTAIALKQGDTAYFTSNGSNYWTLIGGSLALKYANAFKSSVGTSGYQQLPSGLILQWGVTAASSSSGNVSTTFPLAFPNACFGVQFTPNTSGLGLMPDVDGYSATGFTSSLWSTTSTRAAGYLGFYQAIGN